LHCSGKRPDMDRVLRQYELVDRVLGYDP